MKEVKYIPGDLVMTDGVPIGTKKGVAYQVTSSDPNRTLNLKDGTTNKGVVTLDAITEEDKDYFVETSTWVKHIVPIPLTPAILEDNGWEKLDNAFGFPSYNHTEAEWLHLCLEPDGWRAYCLNVVVKEFEFVHQLQHLLFGLGLDNILKV